MAKLIAGLLILILISVFAGAFRMYALFQKTKALEDSISAFERDIPGATMKILVLGDSTAVGTGAEEPGLSTAGRLAALYPQASVRNLAQNGQKLSGLLTSLETIDKNERYSIVLMQVGANDIIRLTAMKDVQRDISAALARISPQADKVILLHSGDVGKSGFFPFYARPILRSRSYEMRETYKKAATTYGASYVDLIDAPADKILNEDPGRYYAADLLHLTGEGYRLWFEEIQKAL